MSQKLENVSHVRLVVNRIVPCRIGIRAAHQQSRHVALISRTNFPSSCSLPILSVPKTPSTHRTVQMSVPVASAVIVTKGEITR
jgi:hypothetical protein